MPRITSLNYVCIVAITGVMLPGCALQERQLFYAIEVRDTQTVRRIVSSNPGLVHATDRWGSSPLNTAIEGFHAEIAKILIDAGADLEHEGGRLGMPLHFASYFGDVEIVTMLLEAGAQVNGQPRKVRTNFDGTPLHNATSGGKLHVAKLLLEHGADVNAENRHDPGWTPLHAAVEAHFFAPDRLATVRLLLEHGARLDVQDSWERTPLEAARFRAEHVTEPEEDAEQRQAIVDLIATWMEKRGEERRRPNGGS